MLPVLRILIEEVPASHQALNFILNIDCNFATADIRRLIGIDFPVATRILGVFESGSIIYNNRRTVNSRDDWQITDQGLALLDTEYPFIKEGLPAPRFPARIPDIEKERLLLKIQTFIHQYVILKGTNDRDASVCSPLQNMLDITEGKKTYLVRILLQTPSGKIIPHHYLVIGQTNTIIDPTIEYLSLERFPFIEGPYIGPVPQFFRECRVPEKRLTYQR